MSAFSPFDELPEELVAAVARDASRDADRVVLFLQTLGLEGSVQRPLSLPAEFLLDLGAALRLLCWEQVGLRVHLEAGFPPAREALKQVVQGLRCRTAVAPAAPAGTLAYRVMVLFAERFAWNGRAELKAEVSVGEVDEEALLEALADFLWEHRPT